MTFNIDAEVYEDFKKNSNGKSYSNVIEDFMRSVNEEKAKEKELIAPLDKSAISGVIDQSNHNQSSILTLNQSLDIYLTKAEINEHINQVNDLSELREIRNRSRMILNVSQTKINNLVMVVKAT